MIEHWSYDSTYLDCSVSAARKTQCPPPFPGPPDLSPHPHPHHHYLCFGSPGWSPGGSELAWCLRCLVSEVNMSILIQKNSEFKGQKGGRKRYFDQKNAERSRFCLEDFFAKYSPLPIVFMLESSSSFRLSRTWIGFNSELWKQLIFKQFWIG